MTSYKYSWLLAVAIVGVYALAASLDSYIVEPPPAEAPSRDNAAQAVCGPNSAWEFINATTLQCYNKRGQTTGKKVLP